MSGERDSYSLGAPGNVLEFPADNQAQPFLVIVRVGAGEDARDLALEVTLAEVNGAGVAPGKRVRFTHTGVSMEGLVLEVLRMQKAGGS